MRRFRFSSYKIGCGDLLVLTKMAYGKRRKKYTSHSYKQWLHISS